MAEIIELDEDEARDIAFEDHPDYTTVTEYDHGSGRWVEFVETIVENAAGQFFKMKWNRGLTENQEHEFYDSKLVEVEQKTRTIVQTYYEEVK